MSAKQKELLELPTRRQIMEELAKRPGLNKHAIASRLDLYDNHVENHLVRLERAGLVRRMVGPRDREVLVFRAEDIELWKNERTRILYGQAATRQVALFLAEHPGAGSRDVADALDVTTATVRHHLDKLEENKLIASLRVGRAYEYHPSNELREWAGTTGANFPRSWREDPAGDSADGEGQGTDGRSGNGA